MILYKINQDGNNENKDFWIQIGFVGDYLQFYRKLYFKFRKERQEYINLLI